MENKITVGSYFDEVLWGASLERTLELLTDGEFVLAYARFSDWPGLHASIRAVIRERSQLIFQGQRRDLTSIMDAVFREYKKPLPQGWVFVSRNLRETNGPCLEGSKKESRVTA